MNRLVDQLLRVARLDSVALDTSQTVDLTAVAEREISTLAPFALRKDCDIVLEHTGTPVMIKGNADAVGDALRNVIENAIVYGPPGGEVMVAVTTCGVIRIADRGPGIPVNQREQVFERFWRPRGERRTGAGLGLAIVHDIMTAHGDTVTIEDNPGGGAVFVLDFGKQAPP